MPLRQYIFLKTAEAVLEREGKAAQHLLSAVLSGSAMTETTISVMEGSNTDVSFFDRLREPHWLDEMKVLVRNWPCSIPHWTH